MTETKKFRANLGTFDLVKGIAMMFVVIGHVFSYYDVAKMPFLNPLLILMFFTANGLMPLFFIISGLGFKEKPVGVMLKKTASELLMPYGLVTVFTTLLFPVAHYLTYRWWPGALSETLRYFLAFAFGISKSGKVLFGYSLYECTAVWFFLAMFVALNLLNLILKVRHEAAQAAFVVACVLAGWGCYVLDFTYYCIPQGLAAVGYYYVGYLFKKHKILERAKSSKARFGLYLALLIVTILQILHGRFNLAYGLFEHFGLEYLGTVCTGILFLFWGAYGGQAECNGLNWIRKIGIYTYWIMCIHGVEQTCIPWYQWSSIMEGHQFLGFLIEIGIKTILYIVVCLILKKVTRYQYLRRRTRYGK